jgi:hypothetical protein
MQFAHSVQWKLSKNWGKYSETSLNWLALGSKNIADLEGWPVLWDFFCKELFGKDLKNRPIFREDQFSEGPVY